MAIKHHINDLPDCILLKIFKYLPSKDHLWRSRNVCTRWYSILVDAELWRISDLSPFKLDNVRLMNHIRTSLSLQVIVYLEVYNKTIDPQVLMTILDAATHIQGLRVNRCLFRGECSSSHDSIPSSSGLGRLDLNFLDLTNSRGNLSWTSTLLPSCCSKINVLGLPNSFQSDYHTIRERHFLSYLGNLQMLECQDCVWVNDSLLTSLANHCPLVQALNFTNCVNIQGTSLHKLLTQCQHLTTLALRKTGIRGDEEVENSIPWSRLNLTELDISCCYKISEQFVKKIVSNLASQLRYLRCAVNDELIQSITDIEKPLRALELRRMHAVNMAEIVRFLSTCECLETLDVSSAPVDYELFKLLLPCLPKLRWLSIAGHQVRKETFDIISEHNSGIEEVSINFYQSRMADVGALQRLILNCSGLRKICVQGSYVKSIASEIHRDLEKVDPYRSVEFCKSSDFTFPLPQLSIKRFAESYKHHSGREINVLY